MSRKLSYWLWQLALSYRTCSNMLFVGWIFFSVETKKAPTFAGAFASLLNLEVLADFHFDLFWLRFLGLRNCDGENAVGVVGSNFLAVYRIG